MSILLRIAAGVPFLFSTLLRLAAIVSILLFGTSVGYGQMVGDTLIVHHDSAWVNNKTEGDDVVFDVEYFKSLGQDSALSDDNIRHEDGAIPDGIAGSEGSSMVPQGRFDEASRHELGVVPSLLPGYLYMPQVIAMPPMPKGSTLPRWATGFVYGNSGISSSLLHGYVATAGVGVRQHFGDAWTVNAGVQLTKYSVLYNTAEFSGSVQWQLSPHVALTVFGSYMPGSFLSPIELGPTYQYGGYVTLQSNGRFGLDLGARQTYDPFSGREVVPIVMPYLKFGEAKIGIDVGPLIKSALEKNNGHENGFSPIPRPIKAIPTVAPRR